MQIAVLASGVAYIPHHTIRLNMSHQLRDDWDHLSTEEHDLYLHQGLCEIIVDR